MEEITYYTFLLIITICSTVYNGIGGSSSCTLTFGSSCYMFHCIVPQSPPELKSWDDVKTMCDNSGGYLVSLSSTDELEAVKQAAEGISCPTNFFIGLKRDAGQERSETQSWTWSSGEEGHPVDSILYWAGSEPNYMNSEAAGCYVTFASGTTALYEVGQQETLGLVDPYPGYICETPNQQTQTTVEISTALSPSTTFEFLNNTSNVSLFTDIFTKVNQNTIILSDDVTTVTELAFDVDENGTLNEIFQNTSSEPSFSLTSSTFDTGNITATYHNNLSNSVAGSGVENITSLYVSYAPSKPETSTELIGNLLSTITAFENNNVFQETLGTVMNQEQTLMEDFVNGAMSTVKVSSDTSDGSIMHFSGISGQKIQTTVDVSDQVKQNGVFQVKTNVTTNHSDAIIYSVYWKTDLLNQLVNITNDDDVYYIFSGVYSFSIYAGPDYISTSSDVNITFRHTEDYSSNIKLEENEQVQRVCSFWDEVQSSFSKYGCITDIDASDSVVCHCNHTTNFAILVQVTENEVVGVHSSALKYITIVGLSISLMALLITLLIYIGLWELWKCLRNNIHKNLVVCMITFNILFLFGADKTENEGSCRAIAVLLHYFLLCMFTWMAAEAVYILDKVVRKTTSKWNKLHYYLIFCYTIPAVIVTITIGISSDNYATDRICWLEVSNGAIFAFLVPMYLILIFNILVTVKTSKVIYERSKGKVSSHPTESTSTERTETKKVAASNAVKASNKAETQQIKRTLRGMLFLIPIFGLTWLFALFAFDSDQLLFQYLFAISNSLQGVFVFVVYCLQDKKTMEALNRKTGRIKRQNEGKSVTKTNTTNI